MRGAPQLGFSRLMSRIRSQTSRGTAGRPGLPLRIFPVQKIRNALRCQATTVSGFTITSPDRRSVRTRERQPTTAGQLRTTEGVSSRSVPRTPIWCRSAMFSSCRAARFSGGPMRLLRGGSPASTTSAQAALGSGATSMVSVSQSLREGACGRFAPLRWGGSVASLKEAGMIGVVAAD